MQQCLARQGRIKSHFIFTQPGPRKRATMGSVLNWAFNFTRWNPSHPDLLRATSCIQTEEKERLMRFVFKKDFKASLIGRLMMRKFVAETSGVEYEKIEFLRDEKGKPFLRDSGCSFNVSHQGEFTVLAGCKDGCLLGVDVMKIEFPRGRNLGEYFRLMSRTFSNNEWLTIKNQPSEKEQLAMFYRHWCLKESYVKATGVGITINLQDVSFKINSFKLTRNSIIDDTQVFFKGRKLSDFHFQEMLLDDNHCVAVASNSKEIEKVPFKIITFPELMENSVSLLPPDSDYCDKFFQKCE